MVSQFRSSGRYWLIGLAAAVVLALSACSGGMYLADQEEDAARSEQPPTATPTPEVAEELEPSSKVEDEPEDPADPIPTPTPTDEPAAEGVNPLTGLAIEDPKELCQPPLLVAVSNFPPSSRPQSGLSTAANVWETFIGEGMTRFLAIFYGDYRQSLEAMLTNRLEEGHEGGILIGPVRSGRVVFEDIKALFPKARLITAGGSSEVLAQLSNRRSVYNQDPEDINSAGIRSDDLLATIECTVEPSLYGDVTFASAAPPGGSPAGQLRIVYNLYNQVGWQHSSDQGAYLRSQDRADGSGELFPAVEALSGDQLAFENVLVLWARHRYVTPTIIEMELVYVRDRYGLLFRDGQVYTVHWSTPGGRLQIHDEAGKPIPLKPGRTFFEVVSYQSTWNPQEMIVRYHNPPSP